MVDFTSTGTFSSLSSISLCKALGRLQRETSFHSLLNLCIWVLS